MLLLLIKSANLGFCAVPAETLEYEAEGKVSGFYNSEGYAQYNQRKYILRVKVNSYDSGVAEHSKI